MSDTINIVSIGSGNIAHHFIPALNKIGCKIDQVFSRNIEHAQKLAYKVKAQPISDLRDIYTDSDLYLIMVKDDAIIDVINQLPQLKAHQILAHTSGATATLPLKKKADNFGCFYALQTFRKSKSVNIDEVPFLIFGNNAETTRKLRMIARQLSPIVSEVTDQERLQYHLAAVLINNFTNHLSCVTNNFLEENNLDPKVLLPITKTTFAKILDQDPCQAQTGPAARNDIKVENKHLQLIKSNAYLSSIYKSMSQSIKKQAKEKDS